MRPLPSPVVGPHDPPVQTPAPVPLPRSRSDRLLAAADWARHPRLVHDLSVATRGFHANGVVRRYENSEAGRRREVLEGPILWHRGYRPPTRTAHNAIWLTGGPEVTIGYNRELLPAYLSDRARELAGRIGIRDR
jgi:hypothetical protein